MLLEPLNPYAPPSVDDAPVRKVSPEPPRDGAFRYRETRNLSLLVIGLLGACALVSLLHIWSALIENELVAQVLLGHFDREAFDAVDERARMLQVASAVTVLSTAMAFLLFVHRTSTNVRALGARNLEYSPAWAVGCFFVPIASLWKPVAAMRELYWAAEPEHDGTSWVRRETPSVIGAWWVLWWAAMIGFSLNKELLSGSHPEQVIVHNQVGVAVQLIRVAAAVCGALVVRELSRRQQERAYVVFSRPPRKRTKKRKEPAFEPLDDSK
ncbi:MAG: DUF4328 domain-containing protein [Polyangiaceae bacterium]|nr:DUF4328 domain-containing protein [Polyangiaceae bacterium]